MKKEFIGGTLNGKMILMISLLSVLFIFTSCKNEKQEEVQNIESSELEKSPTADSEKSAITEVFKVVEEMPRFPGCEDLGSIDEKNKCSNEKMFKYIFEELKYPEEAKTKANEGRVIARFVVSEKGELTDIKIVEDIGDGCGDEVLRVLNTMNTMENKWIPGKQRGKNVKVELTLPVIFKLS